MIVDETHDGQYALHSNDMQKLIDGMVPGSGGVLE